MEKDALLPNYYAIIPASVRYDKKLSMGTKLLYGELTALSNKFGFCFATNEYLADLYSVDSRTISRWISELNDNGFIMVQMVNLYERKIYITEQGGTTKMSWGVDKNVVGGYDKNVVPNTTSSNTTSNTCAKAQVEPDKKAKYTEKGAEIIKAFSEIDPKNKTYYGNKTQREASDFLISEYGYDTVLAVISILKQYNQTKYAKKTYTPYQLKENWQAIKDHVESIKKQKVEIKNKVAFV